MDWINHILMVLSTIHIKLYRFYVQQSLDYSVFWLSHTFWLRECYIQIISNISKYPIYLHESVVRNMGNTADNCEFEWHFNANICEIHKNLGNIFGNTWKYSWNCDLSQLSHLILSYFLNSKAWNSSSISCSNAASSLCHKALITALNSYLNCSRYDFLWPTFALT